MDLKLTDAFIKGIKPQSKTKSYPDGHGLVLLCNPQGSLGWRYRYRFGGKPKMLSFGTYPEVSLKKAREKLALVDLKQPRQPTFVKQANISQGHQQVNNLVEKNQISQNKLLEGQVYDLDSRPQAKAKGVNSEMEALGEVHGGKNTRGEGKGL